ncbi:venom metalloproteinase antarease TserMP_A-like isoform X2 [Ornithodoros turicata]|uniref:venom metalloproteinase antarease TserMP_A-like isoform X2 n=1 Tax=Ornithodoros turicata TaxID=34597 RepID=UPI003139AE28
MLLDNRVPVVALTLLAAVFCADFAQETVVYPQIVQGRADDGATILKLTDDLTLNLRQKPAYGDQLLLRTTREDGVLVSEYVSAARYNDRLFQDDKKMASVVLTQGGGIHVNGIIGEELRIKPLPTMERSSEGHLPHLLYRGDPVDSYTPLQDYIPVPLNQWDALPLHEEVYERNDLTLDPEVHVVFDSTYVKQYNNNTTDIIVYFGAALNSINLRYKTIESIKVRIRVVGFTFNSHVRDEPYILRIRNTRVGDFKATLYSFGNHYRVKEPGLYEQVDMMALITGRDLCAVQNNRIVCNVYGMAFIGGACSHLKTSVEEDRPWSFNIVRTMAHELAHNLGCVHDGEGPRQGFIGHPGAIDCPWDWGYIMSYIQRDTKEYHFSQCCVDQIKYLARLRSRTCLYTNDTYREVEGSRKLPGSITTLDMMCNITHANSGYTHVYDKTREFDRCWIPCKMQHEHSGYYQRRAKAVDGTNCSSTGDMICKRGECVPRMKTGKPRRPRSPKAEHK